MVCRTCNGPHTLSSARVIPLPPGIAVKVVNALEALMQKPDCNKHAVQCDERLVLRKEAGWTLTCWAC